MQNAKRISIIIPFYNVERYLNECLDSVLSSSCQNLEVIAVDDGSTDGSLSVLKSFSDPRLKIFHKKNEGVYKTWRFGVQQSTGDYVVFVDSDDFVEPELFDQINRIIDNADYDLIQFGWTECYPKKQQERSEILGLEEGEYSGLELKKIVEEYVYTASPERLRFPVERWGKVFKAEKLKSFLLNAIEDICMFDDQSLTIPFMTQISSLYVLPKSLYFYRVFRAGSLCNSPEKARQYYRDCKNILRYFGENSEKFGFTDSSLEGLCYYYHLTVVSIAIKAKEYRLAKEILSDEDMSAALKSKSGIKPFLLRRKLLRSFRLIGKIKTLFNGKR